VLVVAGALASVLITVAALSWLRLMKNPFVGVAPDVVSPILILPSSLLVVGVWSAVMFRDDSRPTPPRLAGRLLLTRRVTPGLERQR
jgi:hypothetical protein